MAKMCITIVLDGDKPKLRKVRSMVMKVAHNTLVSCSATFLEVPNDPQPSEDVRKLFETEGSRR